MTLSLRERKVERAIKRLRAAADGLDELIDIATEAVPDADMTRERHFVVELRERADYWERCNWYRTPR